MARDIGLDLRFRWDNKRPLLVLVLIPVSSVFGTLWKLHGGEQLAWSGGSDTAFQLRGGESERCITRQRWRLICIASKIRSASVQAPQMRNGHYAYIGLTLRESFIRCNLRACLVPAYTSSPPTSVPSPLRST